MKRGPLALLVVLAAIATWPFLPSIRDGPMTADAATWVARSAVFQPEWLRWDLATPHFIGYRPLVALSYSLNSALGGLDPLGYRVLDLGLHVVAALLLYAVYRALAPRLPAWGGVLAAAILLAHPAVEHVVRHLAGRSYTLSVCFGLGGVLLACRSLSRVGELEGALRVAVRMLPAVGAVICAVLSNESATVLLAWLPLLALDRLSGSGRILPRLAGASAPFAAAAVMLLAIRVRVIGGIGGYEVEGLGGGRSSGVSAGFARELIGVGGLESPTVLGWAAAVLLGLAVAIASVRGGRGVDAMRDRALPLLLIVWLAGYPILYSMAGAWFPRQLYPALAPFALLVAVLVADAWQSATSSRSTMGWVQAIAALLVPLWLLASSPVVRGPNARRMEARREHQKLLDDLVERASALEEPALVMLVLPYPARESARKARRVRVEHEGASRRVTRAAAIWADAVLHEREIDFQPLLFYAEPRDAHLAGTASGPTPEILSVDGRPQFLVPAGLPHQRGTSEIVEVKPQDVRVWLDDPALIGDRGLWVYMVSGGQSELIPIADPPDQPNDETADRLEALGYIDVTEHPVDPTRSGVVLFDRERASPGENLFCQRLGGHADLISMQGEMLQTWRDTAARHWAACELLEDGDLVVVGSDRMESGDPKLVIDEKRYVMRLSWDGRVRWKRTLFAHHDIERTPDGHLLTLTLRYRRLPEVHPVVEVRDDYLTLLDMEGNVVDERSLYAAFGSNPDEHVLQGVEARDRQGRLHVDLIHANTVEWMHREALFDRHPIYAPDNVLVTSRHQNAVAIIEWESGRLVWAWGPGEIVGPHDAEVLENGNILLLDNGRRERGWSRVVELDPIRKEIVWEYTTPDPLDFFTASRGATQRLPNGNTLITNSNSGQAIEVTRSGDRVWEFLNPNLTSQGHRPTISRVRRYTPEFMATIRTRPHSTTEGSRSTPTGQ